MLSGDEFQAKDFTLREEAISRLIAKHANDDPDVEEFRARVLKLDYSQPDASEGSLLTWAEVELWIQRHAGPTEPPAEPGEVSRSQLHSPVLYLVYGVPGEDAERLVVTNPNLPTLSKLRRLSQYLARLYQWTRAQATVFTLTDIPPLIPSLHEELEVNSTLPALSRIRLTIDPAMAPREVAERYGQVRKYFIGRRHRELTDKHMDLALFAATRLQGATWAGRMAVWNVEHPEWAYTEPSNFGRDCLQAQRRLLGTEILWDRSGDDGEEGQ
jgi:hypothetical protein